MTEKEIATALYKLELHKKFIDKDNEITITRVPSGWIYYFWRTEIRVFVPYDNRFQFRGGGK